jgi:hypothetical protein
VAFRARPGARDPFLDLRIVVRTAAPPPCGGVPRGATASRSPGGRRTTAAIAIRRSAQPAPIAKAAPSPHLRQDPPGRVDDLVVGWSGRNRIPPDRPIPPIGPGGLAGAGLEPKIFPIHVCKNVGPIMGVMFACKKFYANLSVIPPGASRRRYDRTVAPGGGITMMVTPGVAFMSTPGRRPYTTC